MSSVCEECGKNLATPGGLRRHINSQHKRNEWHSCECGKKFLDPAGRSRCRAMHARAFGCPEWYCKYESNRKDSVKQHIKRRHPELKSYEIVTIPTTYGAFRRSSGDSDREVSASAQPLPFAPLPPPIQGSVVVPPPMYVTMHPMPSPEICIGQPTWPTNKD